MKTEIFTDKSGKQFLRVEIALNPHPSKSGKTVVVATTEGNKKTGQSIDGKEVILGLNAYVK